MATTKVAPARVVNDDDEDGDDDGNGRRGFDMPADGAYLSPAPVDLAHDEKGSDSGAQRPHAPVRARTGGAKSGRGRGAPTPQCSPGAARDQALEGAPMHMHGLVICCSVHIGLAGWVWRFLAGAGVRATPALSPIASTALAPAPPPSAAEPQPFTSTFNGLTVRIIPPADPSKRCAVLEPPRDAWKTLNAPGGSTVCRAGRGCSPRVCRAASGARYMAVAAGPGGAW